MGIHLNSHGDLTVSQKEQADALGIPREQYKEMIIKRLEEIRGGKPPKPERYKMKRNKIEAENPVLVIGAGPSWKENVGHYNTFKGKIIAVDVLSTELMSYGVIPDYVITIESAKTSVPRSFFDLQKLRDNNVEVIASSITREEITQYLTTAKVKCRRFIMDEEPRCSNVGLFAINFARQELNADKIIIVGFEHTGDKYTDYVYRVWQTDFWYFIRKWPKETIVNCTNGGVLYYKNWVIESTLDKLKIESRNNNSS